MSNRRPEHSFLPLPASLVLALVVIAAGPASAATYHVAPNGSDKDAGDAAAPFRSIQHAAQIMEPGDTCKVHPGAYRGPIRPARSGTAAKPIRFVSVRPHEAEIYGTQQLKGWQRHEDAIYRTKVDWHVDQLFVDRRLLTEARYPDHSGNPWKPNTITLRRDETTVTGDGLDQPEGAWKGAVLWALDDRLGWVAQQYGIVDSRPGQLTLDTKRGWWRSKETARCFILGGLRALDVPGEWAVRDGYLYVWLPEDAAPTDHVINATRHRFAFDLAGREHIRLEGFRIRCATVNFHEASHCVADGLLAEHVSFASRMKGGFNRDRGINPEAQGLGLILAGENNAIVNSIVRYGTGDGVSIFGRNNTLRNCIVHDFDTSASDCAPVNVTGEGHVIERCTLYNGGRSILVHRKLGKGRIIRNHMFASGLMCRDLGMTYTYQTNGEGTEIAYNRVHHNYAGGWGCVGIYLDDMTSHHIVHHNVVYQVNEAMALNPPKSMHNIVFNNTMVGFSSSIGMSLRRPQDMTGTRFFNNIFTAGTPQLTNMPNVTMGRNLDRGTDPRFTNPDRFDFTLRKKSAAIDAAKPYPPYTDGFIGEAPDLGALEFGRDPWTAGSTLEYNVIPPTDDISTRRKEKQ